MATFSFCFGSFETGGVWCTISKIWYSLLKPINIALALRGPFLLRGPIHCTRFSTGPIHCSCIFFLEKEIFSKSSLCELSLHTEFQNPSTYPSGRKVRSWKEERWMIRIMATCPMLTTPRARAKIPCQKRNPGNWRNIHPEEFYPIFDINTSWATSGSKPISWIEPSRVFL